LFRGGSATMPVPLRRMWGGYGWPGKCGGGLLPMIVKTFGGYVRILLFFFFFGGAARPTNQVWGGKTGGGWGDPFRPGGGGKNWGRGETNTRLHVKGAFVGGTRPSFPGAPNQPQTQMGGMPVEAPWGGAGRMGFRNFLVKHLGGPGGPTG